MKNVVFCFLLLAPFGASYAQTNLPLISSVSVLTIHVRDTDIHQSVFEFLTNVMKLPVEYGPEHLGERRYAAVYAGNMFIEPCGPYASMQYPIKDFQALFFGLNCRSDRSSDLLVTDLGQLGVACERSGTNLFRIQNRNLSGGIYLSLDTKRRSQSEQEQLAAFQKVMETNQREGPGLAYVHEIWIGYVEPADLNRWNEFLGPTNRVDQTTWALGERQHLRLVEGEARGIAGIVWKARSLERAEAYFRRAGYFERKRDGRIELKRIFGLRMYVTGQLP